MKIKLIHSEYNEETGRSYVKIATECGIFDGEAFLHPDDAEFASKYAGCEYAETRALIKYMTRKKQNAMVEYKTLTNLQHEINSRKYHNENSIEARLLQKYIYTAQDNYTVFKNNVKTLREFLKKSIDDRDAYIQKLMSKNKQSEE